MRWSDVVRWGGVVLWYRRLEWRVGVGYEGGRGSLAGDREVRVRLQEVGW